MKRRDLERHLRAHGAQRLREGGEAMIREGPAEPREFNIREIDDRGETVRVYGVADSAIG